MTHTTIFNILITSNINNKIHSVFRKAKLNFRRLERSHLMENMVYNELIRRGYSVDVGIEVT